MTGSELEESLGLIRAITNKGEVVFIDIVWIILGSFALIGIAYSIGYKRGRDETAAVFNHLIDTGELIHKKD